MKDIHELARFGTGHQVLHAIRKNPKIIGRKNARGESPLDVALDADNRGAIAVLRGLAIIDAKKSEAANG